MRSGEVERFRLARHVADGRRHSTSLAGLLRPERHVRLRLDHVRRRVSHQLVDVQRQLFTRTVVKVCLFVCLLGV